MYLRYFLTATKVASDFFKLTIQYRIYHTIIPEKLFQCNYSFLEYIHKYVIISRGEEDFLYFYTFYQSLSRDLNTGPADYKSAALPTKPLRRHIL